MLYKYSKSKCQNKGLCYDLMDCDILFFVSMFTFCLAKYMGEMAWNLSEIPESFVYFLEIFRFVCASILKVIQSFWEILKIEWIVIQYNFDIFGCPCGCIISTRNFSS